MSCALIQISVLHVPWIHLLSACLVRLIPSLKHHIWFAINLVLSPIAISEVSYFNYRMLSLYNIYLKFIFFLCLYSCPQNLKTKTIFIHVSAHCYTILLFDCIRCSYHIRVVFFHIGPFLLYMIFLQKYYHVFCQYFYCCGRRGLRATVMAVWAVSSVSDWGYIDLARGIQHLRSPHGPPNNGQDLPPCCPINVNRKDSQRSSQTSSQCQPLTGRSGKMAPARPHPLTPTFLTRTLEIVILMWDHYHPGNHPYIVRWPTALLKRGWGWILSHRPQTQWVVITTQTLWA